MPFVIAHRGASGLLPEHTLESKALAHGLGAHYLEQDLVLTKDDVPIVLHDLYLDTVSDVETQFPGRARNDGRYYAIDFTLNEIRKLNASERFDHTTGRAVFPHRFPAHTGRFRIPTFEEEIQFIQGLNHSTGRTVGIYPEIKHPGFHEQSGKDITRIMLEILLRYGYLRESDPCYVQCFDPATLKRIRHELGIRLRLVQLLDAPTGEQIFHSAEGMNAYLSNVATYANGLGPALKLVLKESHSHHGSPLIEAAHAAGLEVHPWTLRQEELPEGITSFTELHRILGQSGIDGVFSDFPGESVMLFRPSR